jgi:hypothetical protein
MLVGVTRGDEDTILGMTALGVRVVRVTHPLSACERMRVLRPSVVVVGRGVSNRDLVLLSEAAREASIKLVRLGTSVTPAVVQDIVRRTITNATATEDADLPDSKPEGGGTRKG